MIPAAVAGVAALSSQMIQKDNAPQAEPNKNDGLGIASNMQGNTQEVDMLQDSSPTGSQAPAFMEDMAKSAFQSGFNAVMGQGIAGATSKSASQQGKDMRSYMAEAYPELNPWERAGASATQAGVQMAQNEQAMKMKSMDIQGAKDVAQIQGQNAKDVALIQAGETRYATNTSAFTQRYGIDVQSGNIDKQIAAVAPQVEAQTKLLIEQAKSEAEAKSVVGKTVKDVVHGLQGVVDQATEIGVSIKEGSSLEKVINEVESQVKSIWQKANNWIDDKFKRSDSNGVNGSMDGNRRRTRNSEYNKWLSEHPINN